MKPFLSLWIAFLTGSFPLFAQAQQHAVELSSRWVNHTHLEISAQKHGYGSYTVWISFSHLENTNQPKTFRAVIRGDQKLLTLTPVNKEKPINCRYNYRYIRGYKSSKLDSAFIYRLPFSTHRAEPVMVSSLYNVNQRHFEGRPVRGWKSAEFRLERGDTVFACRKGLVIEVTDGFDPLPQEMEAGFHSKSNDILIEHEDGTLGRYKVFERGSILVKEGDTVYPGIPLGKAGTFSENGDYMIRFDVSFPNLNRNYKEEDPENSSPFEWVYYNPWFATPEGGRQMEHGERYRAFSTDALVQKEMTKKEIKALSGK